MTQGADSGQSIFRQVLQDDFDKLALELRVFHDVRGNARFHGKCRIDSARGLVGRLLCWLLQLPKTAEDAEFAFELTASAESEMWRRCFPGRAMRSKMRAADGQIVERIGPVSLWFSIRVDAGRLVMDLTRLTVLGLRLPRAVTPQVWGNEHASDGVLHFDAGARLPGLGLLTAYRGFLILSPQQSAAIHASTSPCGLS